MSGILFMIDVFKVTKPITAAIVAIENNTNDKILAQFFPL